MTATDREKWDTRYRADLGNSDPSTIVRRFWDLATRGRALDIACGNGRNAVFLTEKGFDVDAVDISAVATSDLLGRHPDINVICTDIDAWRIPRSRYDLIIDIRFLDRRLLPMIEQGLRPGGVLIFESFVGGEEEPYCLKQNELLRAFPAFTIVHYEERNTDHNEKFSQIATLVAIKPDR